MSSHSSHDGHGSNDGRGGPRQRTRLPGGIRPHKKGFRCEAGKVSGPGAGKLIYKRFWLGHDRRHAEILARLIIAEWELHKVHGHAT